MSRSMGGGIIQKPGRLSAPPLMTAAPTPTPFVRLAILLFLQPLSAALWILPFGNILSSRGLGSLVPVIFALPPLATLFAPLLAGTLADRKIPALQLLRYLLGGSSVVMALAAVAIEHAQPGWIIALMLAHSLLFSATGPLATSVVLASSAHPARYFPFFRIGSTVAWIVAGNLISFGMASDFSPRALLVASACEAVLVLFTFSLPLTPLPPASRLQGNWGERLGLHTLGQLKHQRVVVLLGIVLMANLLGAAFFPYAPQLLSSTGINRPSAWMTTAQWSEILFLGLLPLLRVHPHRLMLIGLTCSGLRCLCFIAYAAGAGWPYALLGLACHGPVTAFLFVTMQIFMETNLPAGVRNRAQAMVSLCGGAGSLLGQIVTGGLAQATLLPGPADAHSWQLFWGILALLHAVAVTVFALCLGSGSVVVSALSRPRRPPTVRGMDS